MLNVTPQRSAQGAKSYFLARSDYYSEGQELVGQWGGKGAVLLGLSGEVKKCDFEALCDNLDPRTGTKLTAIMRDDRRVGYDFTWSAPKSVSVTHALTGDERIADAFRTSIRETMSEMEAEMQTRVRKGKRDENRTSGNMAWAEFIHLTSRPVNRLPHAQLHAHCFAFNGSLDPIENKWKAGQFGKIKGDAYYWQAVQQARFAAKLQQLGYSIRPTKDAFEIAGVPESVLSRFSLRSKQIREKAAELGITDPKGREKLALTTREGKDHSIPYPQLVKVWDSMLTAEERAALRTVSAGRERHDMKANDAEHSRFAANHLFSRDSVVEERRLLTLALRHGIGEVTPEGVRREVRGLKLLRGEEDGKTWVTSREIRALEDRMLGWATAGKGAMRPLGAGRTRPTPGSELSAEQQAVVDHLLTSTDRVMLIRGAAGTGKTTLAREAVLRITREAVSEFTGLGRPVVMVAPSTAAVDVLRDEFKDAATAQHLLVDEKLQASARNGVLWLDEAAMVGAKTMAGLFEVAQRVNARVVLMGDVRQLPSVEHGSPMRALEELAGLKVAEIKTVRRQSGEYKEAMELLSEGKAAEGLRKLDGMGCIRLLDTTDPYGPLAEDFAAKLKAVPEKSRTREALIVVPTHAEGAVVNERVRRELKAAGLVGEDDKTFRRLVPLQWTPAQRGDRLQYGGEEVLQVRLPTGGLRAGQRVKAADAVERLSRMNPEYFETYREASVQFAKGDLIRTTAKGKTMDGRHTVGNGSVYRVKGFNRAGNVVLENGWTLSKDFGHWKHAWVNTTYAAQGRTVNHVLVAMPDAAAPAMSRENFYVAASRGRTSLQIWADSRYSLEQAATKSRPRLTATELMRRPRRPAWRCMRDTLARMKLNAMVKARQASRRIPERLRQTEMAHER